MKKLKNIILFSLLIILINACSVKILNQYDSYDMAETYHVISLSGEIIPETFNKIDLAWPSGNVIIENSTTYQQPFIKEVVNSNTTDSFLSHVAINDNTLSIKYCASESSIPANITKDLYLYLPVMTNIELLSINSVSTAITLNDLRIQKLDMVNVSGNVTINHLSCAKINYKGVSGNLFLSVTGQTNNINVEQISGTTIISLNSDVLGFNVDFTSLSGAMTSSFETSQVDNKYLYGLDNNLTIVFNSVSGDLTIAKTKVVL